MTQRGHVLDDTWYLDYAAGALASEAEDVLVRSHIELNDDAEARLARLDQIGGSLLEHLPIGEALPFSADDLLDLADATEGEVVEFALPAAPDALSDVDIPPALAAYLARTGVKVKWEFLGPGLRKAVLWRGDADERLWLLKAEPGVSIPHHGHNGSELTLVLKGSFWDGEQEYRRGDVEEAHPDIEHDIRIDPSGICVCLALTCGKLRFDNPLLRAFQVFTGL